MAVCRYAGNHDLIQAAASGHREHLPERFRLTGGIHHNIGSHPVGELIDLRDGVLACLCAPDAPTVLFHCSAGKDRAGWAASSLLLALGVPEEAVIEHYLLSNEHFEPQKQHAWDGERDEELAQLLAPLVGVHADYAEASLAAVRREWGDFDAYLRDGLGITDAQRDQLRANWLE